MDDFPLCPACGSPERAYLGGLGSLEWFRCRDCGMDFNRKKEVEDVGDE